LELDKKQQALLQLLHLPNLPSAGGSADPAPNVTISAEPTDLSSQALEKLKQVEAELKGTSSRAELTQRLSN
jgi:hypothetical protein